MPATNLVRRNAIEQTLLDGDGKPPQLPDDEPAVGCDGGHVLSASSKANALRRVHIRVGRQMLPCSLGDFDAQNSSLPCIQSSTGLSSFRQARPQ